MFGRLSVGISVAESPLKRQRRGSLNGNRSSINRGRRGSTGSVKKKERRPSVKDGHGKGDADLSDSEEDYGFGSDNDFDDDDAEVERQAQMLRDRGGSISRGKGPVGHQTDHVATAKPSRAPPASDPGGHFASPSSGSRDQLYDNVGGSSSDEDGIPPKNDYSGVASDSDFGDEDDTPLEDNYLQVEEDEEDSESFTGFDDTGALVRQNDSDDVKSVLGFDDTGALARQNDSDDAESVLGFDEFDSDE